MHDGGRRETMKVFHEYLTSIDNLQQRTRIEGVFTWIITNFPNLHPKIAWNQPMFTDHGTYIIGFSIAKQHLAVAPERAGILYFSDEIIKSGYEHTNQLFKIRWDNPVDYELLKKIISYNIVQKKDSITFWRR